MKIVVLLGTQNKSFERLLNALNESETVKKHEIVAQIGYTKFQTNKFKTFDFCGQDEINKLIDEADLLLMHAGVGSITSALKRGKKVIVAPRLSLYKEMKNDHQLEIMEAFTKKGYVIPLTDFTKIDETVQNSLDFIPKKYGSNANQVIKSINDFIENH